MYIVYSFKIIHLLIVDSIYVECIISREKRNTVKENTFLRVLVRIFSALYNTFIQECIVFFIGGKSPSPSKNFTDRILELREENETSKLLRIWILFYNYYDSWYGLLLLKIRSERMKLNYCSIIRIRAGV